MPTLSIVVDDQLLASFPVEWRTYNHSTRGEQVAHHAHTAYVCPTCGKLWARAVYSDSIGYPYGPLKWQCVTRLCLDHGGTLTTLTSPPMSNARHGIAELPINRIPSAYLMREFISHLTIEDQP